MGIADAFAVSEIAVAIGESDEWVIKTGMPVRFSGPAFEDGEFVGVGFFVLQVNNGGTMGHQKTGVSLKTERPSPGCVGGVLSDGRSSMKEQQQVNKRAYGFQGGSDNKLQR